MLGFLVDLHLRMIRTEVTFAAGHWLAGLCLGEAMTRMTGAATSRAAVRIDPADAGIGPRRGIELAVGQDLDGGTVALEATDGYRRRTAEHRAQEIIERGQNLTCLRVMTAFLLVYFLLVACAAVLRRHDHVDHRAVVLECTWIALVGLMAIVTIDAFLAVSAFVPFVGEARVHCLVAAEALCAFRRAPLGTHRRSFGWLLRKRWVRSP